MKRIAVHMLMSYGKLSLTQCFHFYILFVFLRKNRK